ncbi:Retrotransposon Copia-like N-terminal [Arabidopsis thaliana x Arabidopsis arenosa]|uniref:Retrotransposon Copia-like N-terminal n=1 Tax=Arabidopsis thaliana x Arabidopsis arenosa TaxID=1240361 RepID=A0A8T1XP97_9BRAS|nr:Retrotransposon Copia-like N-terminal [Arabidopsis thaliana x Arabidopsis arenosa]
MATLTRDSYDNPYFLTAHDHSGLMLVSDRLTGAGDFGSWHQSMLMALNGRNKLCFVDGSLPKPDDGHRDAAAWSRVNDVVRSWLMNSVSKTIGQSVLYVKTAHGIWQKLLKIYKQNNVPRLYRIEQKLAGLRQGSLDVNSFYTKLVTIWEEVKSAQDFPVCQCAGCDCDLNSKWMELFERNFVIKFLFGLNDSYEHVRESIIMIDPLPDLEKTLNMVIQHEHQQEIKQPPQAGGVVFQMSSQQAQSSYDPSFQNNPIFTDNSGSNEVIGAVSGGYRPKQRPICTYCGLQGHIITKCYKLHGFPLGYKSPAQSYGSPSYANQNAAPAFVPKQFNSRPPFIPQQQQQQQYGQQFIPQQARMQSQKGPRDNMVGNVITTSPAVQDHFHQVSNALAQLSSEQIAQLATQLTTKSNCSMPSISETPGVTYPSTSAGNIICTTFSEPCLNFNAWIIDSGATTHVCCNLSLFADINSISDTTVKLPNSSQIIINQSGTVMLSDKLILKNVLFIPSFHLNLISELTRGLMIGKGHLENKLYFLDNASSSSSSQAPSPFICNLNASDSSSLWHSRLGHPSFPKLQVISEDLSLSKTKLKDWSHYRHKFTPRATTSVFLGYPSGYKGYKVLDLDTHSISISRNVIFHEDIFHFQSPELSSSTLDLFSSTILPLPIPDTSLPSPFIPFPIPAVLSDNSNVSVESESTIHVNANRPKRNIRTPTYLADYHYNLVIHMPNDSGNTSHPLQMVLDYSQLNEHYQQFILNISAESEPKNFGEAIKSEKWHGPMNEELQTCVNTGTFSVVTLPEGKNPIGCRWVYRIKHHADGTIDRYRARLVAKGYTQQEGVDYIDTFLPVAKLVTVKLLLDLAAKHNWSLTQMDVTNAFLHGDLEEEIYMELPPGYTPPPGESLPPNAVWKLHKSLYGLKQASRQWNKKFSDVLLANGFIQSQSDHTLFVRQEGHQFLALLVYVDDILIASNSDEAVSTLKNILATAFKLKDLGPVKYFLGLEIARNKNGISVCQRKYTLDLLESVGLLGCKPVATPMDSDIHLHAESGDLLPDATVYRALIGKLLYLTITRADITFAVHKLSQYLSQPRTQHLQAAHRIVRYLKGDPGRGLFYAAKSEFRLQAFSDADWGTCQDSRRSTTGFCVFFGSSLISWKSRKQQTASRSSAESEYRALADTTCELLWLSQLLKDLHVQVTGPANLYCDSTAAIQIASNSVFHERTKHIEIDCHIVRDRYKAGFLNLLHVTTDNQLADLFTKALPPKTFKMLMSRYAFSSLFLPS